MLEVLGPEASSRSWRTRTPASTACSSTSSAGPPRPTRRSRCWPSSTGPGRHRLRPADGPGSARGRLLRDHRSRPNSKARPTTSACSPSAHRGAGADHPSRPRPVPLAPSTLEAPAEAPEAEVESPRPQPLPPRRIPPDPAASVAPSTDAPRPVLFNGSSPVGGQVDLDLDLGRCPDASDAAGRSVAVPLLSPEAAPLWVALGRVYIRRQLRRELRVDAIEVDGLENFNPLIEQGDGVLIAPDHADSRRGGDVRGGPAPPTAILFMAAYQIFRGLDRVHLPRLGIFPVDREGSDLRAFRAGVEILARGKNPLVVFPEGEIYHMSDRLTPLREGPRPWPPPPRGSWPGRAGRSGSSPPRSSIASSRATTPSPPSNP